MRPPIHAPSIVIGIGLLAAGCGPLELLPPGDPDGAAVTITSFDADPPQGPAPLIVSFAWQIDWEGAAALACELEIAGPGATSIAIDPCPQEGATLHEFTIAGSHPVTLHAEAGGASDGAALQVVVGAPLAGTGRVSVRSDGGLADGDSQAPDLSADGRFVAFASVATNLVDGDTNGVSDVFVHDRFTGTTERVSVSSAGAQASGPSRAPSISGDGRWVAFTSEAPDLVPADGNAAADVFVHDRATGTTERVSIATDGSEADADSGAASISADGRLVLFASEATNLTAEGVPGLFVHDRDLGTTERVPAEVPSPNWAASADLRYLTFNDGASVIVFDRSTLETFTASVTDDGSPVSGDSVAWSVGTDGQAAFHTIANDVVSDPQPLTETWHVVVHEQSVANDLVSVAVDGSGANAASHFPVITPDGRHVAFLSLADDLVPGDTHVGWSLYLRDRAEATTLRVPVSSGPAQQPDFEHAVSADGRHVAFVAIAGEVVDGVDAGEETLEPHPDGVVEVFVRTVGD